MLKFYVYFRASNIKASAATSANICVHKTKCRSIMGKKPHLVNDRPFSQFNTEEWPIMNFRGSLINFNNIVEGIILSIWMKKLRVAAILCIVGFWLMKFSLNLLVGKKGTRRGKCRADVACLPCKFYPKVFYNNV